VLTSATMMLTAGTRGYHDYWNGNLDLDLDSTTRKESGVYSGESDALSSCCSHSTCTEGDGDEDEDSGELTPTASHVDLVWQESRHSFPAQNASLLASSSRSRSPACRTRSSGGGDRPRSISSFGHRYCGIYERELDKTLEADQWEERADHVFNMAEVGLRRHFVWQRSDDSFSVLDIVTPTNKPKPKHCSAFNAASAAAASPIVNVRANKYCDLDSSSSISTPVSSLSSSPCFSEDEDDVSVNRWSACWNDDEFTLVLQQRCYMPETRC
jgi:hypothetical protein